MCELTTHGQLRATILGYGRSHKLATKKPIPDEPVPMDIDGVITKGGGQSNTYCDIGRREGHWTSAWFCSQTGGNYNPGTAKGNAKHYNGGKATGGGTNNYQTGNQGKAKGNNYTGGQT